MKNESTSDSPSASLKTYELKKFYRHPEEGIAAELGKDICEKWEGATAQQESDKKIDAIQKEIASLESVLSKKGESLKIKEFESESEFQQRIKSSKEAEAKLPVLKKQLAEEKTKKWGVAKRNCDFRVVMPIPCMDYGDGDLVFDRTTMSFPEAKWRVDLSKYGHGRFTGREYSIDHPFMRSSDEYITQAIKFSSLEKAKSFKEKSYIEFENSDGKIVKIWENVYVKMEIRYRGTETVNGIVTTTSATLKSWDNIDAYERSGAILIGDFNKSVKKSLCDSGIVREDEIKVSEDFRERFDHRSGFEFPCVFSYTLRVYECLLIEQAKLFVIDKDGNHIVPDGK